MSFVKLVFQTDYSPLFRDYRLVALQSLGERRVLVQLPLVGDMDHRILREGDIEAPVVQVERVGRDLPDRDPSAAPAALARPRAVSQTGASTSMPVT